MLAAEEQAQADSVGVAQDVLNAYPGDPHRLDGDDDGEACESLR
ncbi:MAG: excalibur calcium-binding domain-containing protein [Cyanobacteria bacterium J06559_3]